MIWDELIDSRIPLPEPTDYTTIKLIKENPDLSFFDIKSTAEKETAVDVVRKSFSESVKVIEKWKQKKKMNPNGLSLRILYPAFSRLAPFSYHVRHGGNESIVNAHSERHGPSWRMCQPGKARRQRLGVYREGSQETPEVILPQHD